MALNIKDLAISSPAFGNGDPIPRRYAQEGDDTSPPLVVTGVPEGTRELAVICHDPDAPLPHGFTHWVLYGIPPTADGITEGGGGAFKEGDCDYGTRGYRGPNPPPGHGPHLYYFFVYALDAEIPDGPGLTRPELLDRVSERMIEMNRLVGTYER